MKRFLLVLLALIAIGQIAVAEDVTFNYEGRIKVSGNTYTGVGYFKLAIVSQNGQLTLWSNDGTSVTGDEPSAAFITDVTDGVFNIIVGDTSTANMEGINPSVFNSEDKVYLRVWFSDTESDFERMNPDRRITNPALLGIQSSGETTIYVDPVNGSNGNSGLEASAPKRTIQSAWDSVPSLVKDSYTIQLAEGIYQESVLLSGKSIIGDATILLVGSSDSPDTVRITREGTDFSDSDKGFTIDNQESVYLDGMLFDFWGSNGVLLRNNSSATLRNCNFTRCGSGALFVARDSSLSGTGLEISQSVWGICITDQSYAEIDNTYIHDCSARGIHVERQSRVVLLSSNIENCTDHGVIIAGLSIGRFGENVPPEVANTIKGCSVGIFVRHYSVGSYTSQVIFLNNGQNLVNDGGTFWQ